MRRKVIFVDPPSGWRYGFPKTLPVSSPGEVRRFDLRGWLIANGYPEEDVDFAMKHCRFWEAEEMETPMNDNDLNAWRDTCHSLSAAAGWWPATVRPNEQYATKIALIHSEASEMLEGLRKGKMDDHLPHRTAEEVEAADLLIRLFDYAGARGLDLDGAIREKLEYNQHRADHKPEARAADGGKKI